MSTVEGRVLRAQMLRDQIRTGKLTDSTKSHYTLLIYALERNAPVEYVEIQTDTDTQEVISQCVKVLNIT